MKFNVAALSLLVVAAGAMAEDQPAVETPRPGSGQVHRPDSGQAHRPDSGQAGEGSSIADQIDLYDIEDYRKQDECINLRKIKRTKALGNQSMLFFMRDGTVYLNQFGNPCPRIGPPMITSFESRFAGRFCRLDRIQISDRTFGVMGFCNIGVFEEVTIEQAEMILSETKSGRKVRESVEKEDAR